MEATQIEAIAREIAAKLQITFGQAFEILVEGTSFAALSGLIAAVIVFGAYLVFLCRVLPKFWNYVKDFDDHLEESAICCVFALFGGLVSIVVLCGVVEWLSWKSVSIATPQYVVIQDIISSVKK